MPWSSMNQVPQALKTAGLTLPQANVWAKYYDQGKAADMKAPGGFAWHQFEEEYTKEGGQWKQKQVKKYEIEIPYILENEAILKEGEANDIFYSAEEIKASIPYLNEVISEDSDPELHHKNSVFCDHDDLEEGTWKWIGEFKNYRWDEAEKILRADVYIVDESIAKKIAYQKESGITRFGISPRLEINEKDGKAYDIKFKGISLVIFPAGGPKLMLEKNGDFRASSSFFKRDDDQRIVYGIVLEPETVDSQGDWFDAETIREACYEFMEEYQILTVQHRDKFGRMTPVMSDTMSKDWNSFWNLDILENFLAPVEFVSNGQFIKKGSWIMASRVKDDEVWKEVKSGKITGYSIGGHAE